MGNRDRLIEADETICGCRAVVLRNNAFGTLNGYIGIPSDSEHYGKHHDDFDVIVHGGWTYSNDRHPCMEESDGRWWFGFDTMHLGDALYNTEWLEREYGPDSVEAQVARRVNSVDPSEDSHLWTVEEVRSQLLRAILSI